MMKKITIIYCLFVFIPYLINAQDTVKSTTTGFKLPSVELKTLDGVKINTSEIENGGKPIIISFWAMWCTNCMKELKALDEVYADWQAETGVKLVAISIDDAKSVDKVKPFVNGKNWDYEFYLDPNKDLYRALNINQIPHTFILNGKGEVVWQHVTYTEGSETEMYEIIKKIASGQNTGN